VFLERERKYSPLHFYNTHASSRKTLLTIARTYNNIPIKLIESEYIELKESGSMKFTQKEFIGREQLIEYLNGIQYTVDKVKELALNDQ
jgi:hypothetical protein